jgi:hypothetical protein
VSIDRAVLSDPRIQSALAELEGMIRDKYPTATFAVSIGDDPDGVYLTPTVDVDDTDEVFDVVVDRLVDMQVEEELPVYVIPIRTPERIAALRRDAVARRSWAQGDLFERVAVITEG